MHRLYLSLSEPDDSLRWHAPDGARGVAASAAELPPAREIWLVAPAHRVSLKELRLSRRAVRQLGGALINALEDRLLADPALVHAALGRPEAEDRHPLALLERAWLEQHLARCRQMGLEPAGMAPEPLLWGEADGECWQARWDGVTGFVRTSRQGGFALDDGSVAEPPLALRLALAEAREQGVAPAALLLETDLAVDLAAWSARLDCPVRAGRLEPDPRPPLLNVLQGDYAPDSHAAWRRFFRPEDGGRYRLAAGLALAALAVHGIGVSADWARLSLENRELRGEMRRVFQETFPQTQAIVDPSLQMQRQWTDLRRARGEAGAQDFLPLLAAVSAHVGAPAGLRYETGRLVLEGPARLDREALAAALASRGYRHAISGEGAARRIEITPERP